MSEQHETISWTGAARLIQALSCGACAMCTLAHFHSSFFFHPAPNLSPVLRTSVLRTANSLHVLRWSTYGHGTASVSYAYFGHHNVSVLRSHFHFGHRNVSVLRSHFPYHVTRSSELVFGAPSSILSPKFRTANSELASGAAPSSDNKFLNNLDANHCTGTSLTQISIQAHPGTQSSANPCPDRSYVLSANSIQNSIPKFKKIAKSS